MPGGLSTSPYTSLEMSCLQQNLAFWCPTFEPHNSFVCIVAAMLFHIMKPTATQREERMCSLAYDHWISMTPASWVYIHLHTLHNSAFCTNAIHHFLPWHQDAPQWIRRQRRLSYNFSSMMSSLCHSMLSSATIFAAKIWSTHDFMGQNSVCISLALPLHFLILVKIL